MLKRRDTLRLATSAFAGSALSAAGAMAADRGSERSLAAAIRTAYADTPASRILGRRWLEQQPTPMTAAALEAALRTRGTQACAPVDGLTGTALRHWVTDRMHEDFASSDVEDVDGWRLARTEVLVCAVMALQ